MRLSHLLNLRCFCYVVEDDKPGRSRRSKVPEVIKMLSSQKKHTPPVCPTSLRRSATQRRETGKPTEQKGKFRWLRWLFPITGLLALIWFLVRVIPKPSRATYPCQRVAFPLASGFVVWLLGIIGSTIAYRKAKRAFAQAHYVIAAIAMAFSAGFIWMALSSTNQSPVYAHEPIVANSPLGEGRGVYPGRVAWMHDPLATDWDGSYPPYWYNSIDQEVINEMLSDALRALTGRDNDVDAWDAIFKQFNYQMGRGYVGYTSGEKIAIKTNWVLMINQDGGTKPSGNRDRIDNAPQLAIALLRQLIDNAGVSPGDISIGDPQNNLADYWYNMVSAECPGVVYLVKNGSTLPHGTPVSPDTSAPFYWSDPITSRVVGKTQDYIPTHFSQADYFINFPILKSHNSAGVTLSDKNNYGSLMRAPNASGYYNMHWTRPHCADTPVLPDVPGIGHYRAVVDLMGHPKLGGKTILVLIDGLYGGQSWDSQPIRYLMPPFNHDWPSSIFLSQDQVAADSVAYDFLHTELDGSHTPTYDPNPEYDYPQYSGTDDYLHEAALIPDPCSGTNYNPNHDGGLTESLGVHEHWNNATDKQYSRNLDPINGTGIELVTEPTIVGDFYRDGVVDFKDFAIFAAAWGSEPDDDNWKAACDISETIDGVIDELDLKVFCENWL